MMTTNHFATLPRQGRPSRALPTEIAKQILGDPILNREDLKRIIRANCPSFSELAKRLYWQTETPTHGLLARLEKMRIDEQQIFDDAQYHDRVRNSSWPTQHAFSFLSPCSIVTSVSRTPRTMPYLSYHVRSPWAHNKSPSASSRGQWMAKVFRQSCHGQHPITSDSLYRPKETNHRRVRHGRYPPMLINVLSACRKIEVLALEKQSVTLINPSSLIAIAAHPIVRQLRLSSSITAELALLNLDVPAPFANVTALAISIFPHAAVLLFHHMKTLVKLQLKVRGSESIFPALRNLTSLEHLDIRLSAYDLTEDDVCRLASLCLLKFLALTETSRTASVVNPQFMASVLGSLPRLESLSLYLHNFSGIDFLVMLGEKFVTLKSLVFLTPFNTPDELDLQNVPGVLFPCLKRLEVDSIHDVLDGNVGSNEQAATTARMIEHHAPLLQHLTVCEEEFFNDAGRLWEQMGTGRAYNRSCLLTDDQFYRWDPVALR